MNYRAILVFVFAAGAMTVAGCGGGTSSNTALPVAFTTPIPAPAIATPAAFSVTNTVALPTPAVAASAVAVSLPVDRTTGSTASISVPISAHFTIPANEAVAETLQSALDSSDPVFQSAGRSIASVRALKDTTGRIALSLMKLSFSVDLALGGGLGLTYVLPGTYPTTGVSYYVAYYDPLTPSLGWQQGYESSPVVAPITLSTGGPGTQFAFTGNPNPITFRAYQTYRFLLYVVSAAAPAPTAAPTNAPTVAPAPTPAPVVANPTSLAFATATSVAQTVTVSEAGFTGNYTLRGLDNCANIVTPTSSGSTVTVTPQGAGACTFYVVGNIAFSPISVTVSNPSAATIAIPPTPAPVPTASPIVLPVASPSAATVGTGATTTISVGETGYTGSYFASVADPNIASLNPTVWSLPGPGQFIVTGHSPGTTTITFTDGALHATTIPLTVTVGAPSMSVISTVGTPITITRGSPKQLSLVFPTYPGSATTVNTPTVTPAGCVTVADGGPQLNGLKENYAIAYVPAAPTNCTATVTFSEVTGGTTGSVQTFVIVP